MMHAGGYMGKLVWAVLAVLVVMQLAFALELMELSSLMRRIASIDEKTAVIKNEAAVKALESERIRANYYRVLSTSPFKLSETTVNKIIREGVREEMEGRE